MNVAIIENASTLPSLIDRASAVLAGARNSAEILEAKEIASFAYDIAKRSARLQKAKNAHDELVSATHRAQADALEIEALAKRKLADEYDAAQERGEVQKHGGQGKRDVPDENIPTVEDIGLTRKDIYEARQIRDAEVEQPGIVRETLDKLLEQGQEPTRAAVTNAIVNRTSFTGNNEWYTPERYIELAREVLGNIDVDPASNDFAQQKVRASEYYTEETNGLNKNWVGNVWLNPPYAQPAIGDFINKIVDEVEAGHVKSAVMLTHNYTDTAWFQKAARAATAICFTRGRVKFEGPNGEVAAPTQGQAFFYFGDELIKFCEAFSDVGFIVEVR
jgi:phage N-6-adenine-methyltransferase